jgi:hypothetical protein
MSSLSQGYYRNISQFLIDEEWNSLIYYKYGKCFC